MLTKSEFLASLQREVAITKHLVSKLDAGHLDHRFTAPQRSERIQYLRHLLGVRNGGGLVGFCGGIHGSSPAVCSCGDRQLQSWEDTGVVPDSRVAESRRAVVDTTTGPRW